MSNASTYSGLQQRLFHSASKGHMLAGVEHLFVQTAWVRLVGAGAMASDTRVGGWIRGCLGHELVASASLAARAGQRCDWDWPCGLEMLFGHQGHTRGNRPIAKPYVPLWQADGDDLLCGVRLFGFACEKIELVLDALIRGLRAPGTLKLHARHLDDKGFAVISNTWISDDQRQPVEAMAEGRIVLETLTPLCLPSGADWADGRDLVSAMLGRLGTLLRWCDFDAHMGFKALLEQGQRLDVEVLEQREARWVRRSHRQSGRTIGVRGQYLTLELGGVSQDLLRLFSMADITFMGDRCTLGLGRVCFRPPV